MLTDLTYLGCAGLGILLVGVGTFLGFAHADVDHGGDSPGEHGGGEHGEADDAGRDQSHTDAGSGLSLLSMAGMGAVLVGFGAVGYLGSALGGPDVVAVPLGLVGAVACFRLTAWLRRTLIRNLETGHSAGEQDLLFRSGTVTVPIPGGGSGRGQVLVHLGERRFYISARTELARELELGEQVVITALEDGLYLVDEFAGPNSGRSE